MKHAYTYIYVIEYTSKNTKNVVVGKFRLRLSNVLLC